MKTEEEVEEFRQHCSNQVHVSAFEAGIPRDFWMVKAKDVTANLDVFREVIRPYCEQIVRARAKGYGLLLLGDNGVGKTMFVSYVLMKAIQKGLTAYYTTLPQLDYDLKLGFKDRLAAERMRWLTSSDFLALDEMGKEKFKAGDSYMRMQVERILKERFDDSMPTLIASNADMETLEEIYGASLTSILLGKYQPATLEPGDFRKQLGEKMRREMKFGK